MSFHKLGIGTRNPTKSLDVSGNMQISNSLDVSGNVIIESDLIVRGTPYAPTAASGTNTMQIATTAFVKTALNSKANLVSPTFTGTTTLADVSMNGNVDISGSLTVSNGLTLGTSLITQSTVTNLLTQLGEDIDGEAAGDESGYSVSLSADGTIVAIGAYNNNSVTGHVRVYQRDTNATIGWTQLGGDIDGEAASDRSGWSVSLSSDGFIVAIGATFNNNANGHVRVYQYDSTKTTADTNQSSSTFGPVGWNRLGQDIDGYSQVYNYFGSSVSLSEDGSFVAIGAYGNNSFSGHVRVY